MLWGVLVIIGLVEIPKQAKILEKQSGNYLEYEPERLSQINGAVGTKGIRINDVDFAASNGMMNELYKKGESIILQNTIEKNLPGVTGFSKSVTFQK